MDGLRSLMAIAKHGTVSEAAVELRITQSAVTKRVQALENEIGYRVVERDGRRIRLTVSGLELISRAKPVLLEIESLKFLNKPKDTQKLSIGVADSIAASWGPKVLRRALSSIDQLKLEIHVHRSTLILENIRLGRYDLGLITSKESERGLVSSQIFKEEMVLVRGRKSLSVGDRLLTMETASATWREISIQVMNHSQLRKYSFEFVESFAAAAQMAREGFGHALVPAGIARSLGFHSDELLSLAPRIHRHIQLVSRKTIFELEPVQRLCALLPDLVIKD